MHAHARALIAIVTIMQRHTRPHTAHAHPGYIIILFDPILSRRLDRIEPLWQIAISDLQTELPLEECKAVEILRVRSGAPCAAIGPSV